MIEAVQTRGTEFVLFEDETSLRNAGANDLLLKAIFENLTAEFKKKISGNLYSKFATDRFSNSLEIKKDQVK